MNAPSSPRRPHVVIVGGGFAGLYTAKHLRRSPVEVTLIDKRNFHLFQPLLYQVATGSLSPADIASPLRGVLKGQKNVQVLMDEVVDIDPDKQKVVLKDHPPIAYDWLVVATGVSHHYFGNDHWAALAPGLKTIEDALTMRQRIFAAFEAAEKESDPERQQAWLTFVIVGAGPTGVELAGAIAEIAHSSLKDNFHRIDTRQAKILLIEGVDRVLPPYKPQLSARAQRDLEDLGVTVLTERMVTDITPEQVTVYNGDQSETIVGKTVLWAAGVRASSLGKVIGDRTGAELDRAGRVMVNPDLSVASFDNIFVLGDLANYSHQGDRPLPGVAPVAMQQAAYLAELIPARLKQREILPFYYTDYGSLAVIGQNKAVVDLGFAQFTGLVAWMIWVWAHVYYLIEFDNKLIVMLQWGWNYFTRGRGARLITDTVHHQPLSTVGKNKELVRP
ncbi:MULTISPECIES: NAD(P)/FAD-dependent oxidoreductase [unclassified Synechocystis]|uniref:NAD(P)/FAD-dependent oxidoreductase n=1 Tax=unclassified Synechocystis TaxID=2640012 RepID=UPI000414BAF5|nr:MULTISPECIES: NAD(P)/FAD-dependent oxidoreductase [unclassified Synechocystis]AIE74868.1 NADH dehydrogenase [Synechocystis sp. PCC 6714]MCT0253412.1 NAD(P)/FAD-dependent oxidoreductase [Synechocystis sp. CS-94]